MNTPLGMNDGHLSTFPAVSGEQIMNRPARDAPLDVEGRGRSLAHSPLVGRVPGPPKPSSASVREEEFMELDYGNM